MKKLILPLSPFIVNSSTTKIDTRARGRYANLKIENTAAGESWRFGTFQVDYTTRWKKIMTKIVVRLPEPKRRIHRR